MQDTEDKAAVANIQTTAEGDGEEDREEERKCNIHDWVRCTGMSHQESHRKKSEQFVHS